MNRLWRWLPIAVIGLLGLVVVLPFSAAGSRLLLAAANATGPLQVEYTGGRLLGELQLARLLYRSDELTLELRDIEYELTPACLWTSRFCLDRLSASSLELGLVETPDEAQPMAPETSASLLTLPFGLEISQLQLATARVHWRGGQWRQSHMTAAVVAEGSTITVSQAQVEGARLVLEDLDPAAPADDTPLLLPILDLPLELKVEQLSLIRPSWYIYGAEHQHDSLSVSARWQHTRLQFSELRLASDSWAELVANGSLEFSANWPLQLEAGIELAEIPGWQSLSSRRIELVVGGDLAELTVEASAAGEQELALQGFVQTLNPGFPFEAVASANWAGSLVLAELMPELEPALDLQLLSPWELSVSGSLQSQTFDLSAAVSGLGYQQLNVVLRGQHGDRSLRIDVLELTESGQDSALQIMGEVQFFAEQSQAVFELQSTGFKLPEYGDYISGRMQGSMRGSVTMGEADWRLQLSDVALDGVVNEHPARITGDVGLDQDFNFSQGELLATVNGARLSLVVASASQMRPVFNLSVENLSRWLADAEGSLALSSELSSDADSLLVQGKLESLRWQQLLIGSGHLQGRYQLVDQHSFDLDLALTALQWSDLSVSTVSLQVSGNAERQQLRFIANGDLEGSLALSGQLRGKDWQGQLLPTTLQTPFGHWQLSEPVRLDWLAVNEQLKVDDHCWTAASATLCIDQLLAGQEGQLSGNLTGDMSFLASLWPEQAELEGQLQLALDTSWSATTAALLELEARVTEGRLSQYFGPGEPARYRWQQADGRLSLGPNGIAIAANLLRENTAVAALNLNLPIDNSKPLSGKLQFNQLQLAPFSPFFTALASLNGSLGGQVDLAGTLEQPLAYGELALDQLQFAVVGNPTQYEAINLVLGLRGDWAEIRGSGLAGGGELNIAGRLLTVPEPQVELSLKGSNQTLLFPPSMHVQVSEDVKLLAKPGLLDLSGQLFVHSGELEHDQLPEDSVAVSPDVVEVDISGNPLREQSPYDLSLDLDVLIEDGFRVVGRGLNAEVGGELQLTKEATKPLQLFGNLNVLGGEINAYGQRLRIKQGGIGFVGAPENPKLDLRAERDIAADNVTVGVAIHGTAETPQLELYSDPAMPQTEQLSYLARGRGLDTGASADGAALALSLGLGLVNRTGVVAELNKMPGINQVEFGTAGSADDTTATLSGYIGRRIYLSYGVGVYEPINVLTARLYVQTQLWVEVVSSLENTLDLYYSFDLD